MSLYNKPLLVPVLLQLPVQAQQPLALVLFQPVFLPLLVFLVQAPVLFLAQALDPAVELRRRHPENNFKNFFLINLIFMFL